MNLDQDVSLNPNRQRTKKAQVAGRNDVGAFSGATALFPIRTETISSTSTDPSLPDRSVESELRRILATLPTGLASPFARVPNTYFIRFFILKDVFDQGPQETLIRRLVTNLLPSRARPGGRVEHLKSPYLVMSVDFHGKLDEYCNGWWNAAAPTIQTVFGCCVAGRDINSGASLATYVRSCQVNNSLLFLGSNDHSLTAQLKALYVKQQFSTFVEAAQNLGPTDRQAAFKQFVADHRVSSTGVPTWLPGAETLATVEAR